MKKTILSALQSAGRPMDLGEIYRSADAEGDFDRQHSVRGTIFQLKKRGEIIHVSRGVVYVIA